MQLQVKTMSMEQLNEAAQAGPVLVMITSYFDILSRFFESYYERLAGVFAGDSVVIASVDGDTFSEFSAR